MTRVRVHEVFVEISEGVALESRLALAGAIRRVWTQWVRSRQRRTYLVGT